MKNLSKLSFLKASLSVVFTAALMSNALAQTPPPYNGLDPVPIENYPQHAPFDGTFFFYYAADDCSNGKLIMIKVAVPPTGPGGDPKLPTDPVVLDEPEEPEDGDDPYTPGVFYDSGQFTSGGSSSEYEGERSSSGTCSTSSCCGSTGAGGGGNESGNVNTSDDGFTGDNADNATGLPEAHFQRLEKNRFPRRTSGSLGWHNYYRDYDNTLFLHKNNLSVQYLNPSVGDHNIITGYDAGRGAWADTDEAIFGIFLYDATGAAITAASDRNLAKSALVLRHNGTTEHHDIFFSQSSGTGNSRLTALADRNGNTIDLEYIDTLPTDHIIPSGVEMSKFHRRTLIRDAYGKETTFTWDRWSGLYVIMSATYPNGETSTYEYANFGTFNSKALKKINHPDGTTTTFSVVDDTATGLSELTVFDASARGSKRKRKTYQSLKYSIQPDGSSIKQSTNMIRKAVNC